MEELQLFAGRAGGIFLGELNRRLHHFFEPLPTSMFATALYLVIDTVTGVVRFLPTPGILSPFIFLARNIKCERWNPTSFLLRFALGMDKDSVYPTEEVFGPSRVSLLFLYTDGLCDLGEGKDLSADDPLFLSLVQNCARQQGEAFLDAVPGPGPSILRA